MTFRQENGIRREAVLLAATRNWMRIVPAGAPDTIELTQQDGCWRDERGGRIVERGTHAELMAARGLYHEMVVRQMESHGQGTEELLR